MPEEILTVTANPPPVIDSGTNTGAPLPVYVPWPGMGGVRPGGGSPAYDPKKVAFSGLSELSESQTKINQFLDDARNAYPQNAEQIWDEANALLTDLINTGLINQPEFNAAANALQESIKS